jgi:hypothetical protein
MKPTTLIGILAIVILAAGLAFYIGQDVAEESDGPAEQLGESLDNAAEDLEQGAEDAQDAAQ